MSFAREFRLQSIDSLSRFLSETVLDVEFHFRAAFFEIELRGGRRSLNSRSCFRARRFRIFEFLAGLCRSEHAGRRSF